MPAIYLRHKIYNEYYKIISSKLIVKIIDRQNIGSVGFKFFDSQAKFLNKEIKDHKDNYVQVTKEEFDIAAVPVIEIWEKELNEKIKIFKKIKN